jgi:acyl-CoA synthetase (AMP-forming)/AMP-acid ligase II
MSSAADSPGRPGETLAHLYQSQPADNVALISPERRLSITYGELAMSIDLVARSLASAGVAPGGRVAMTLSNGPEIVVAFLGIVASGAGAAPLNPAYTLEEFGAYLDDLGPTVMLFAAGAESPAREACAIRGIRCLDLVGDARHPRIEGVLPSGLLPIVDSDSIALLLHTSGTTSRPKGVPLRQRNLAASARVVAETYRLGPADVSHCVMPLFHVHGLVASTLATLSSGGTVVAPSRFSATSFWQDSGQHGVTWYSAVPTIHRILLSLAEKDGVPPEAARLRFARSCSSPLPAALLASFEERMGIPLVEAYGMTEAAHQMASNPLPPGVRRPSSVGLPTGVDVAILDDEWMPVGTGAVGEVCVRGAGLVDGYRDNPEATAATFRDGWFRTGDSGFLSADGYLHLAGRIKELINRGGEKISPHEVEDAILSHPLVIEAVAFAVPDDKYGEEVAVVVVTRGETEPARLQAYCEERLASFKVPRRIVVVDAIPKGPTGKVQRRHMASLLSG